jgi:hypothetical protein
VQISIDKPFRWKCLTATAGPVRVTFRGPGGARTVAINDQCGHLTATGGRRPGWRLRGRLRYGTFDATFEDLFRQTGQRTFSYKARFGGQTRQRPLHHQDKAHARVSHLRGHRCLRKRLHQRPASNLVKRRTALLRRASARLSPHRLQTLSRPRNSRGPIRLIRLLSAISTRGSCRRPDMSLGATLGSHSTTD